MPKKRAKKKAAPKKKAASRKKRPVKNKAKARKKAAKRSARPKARPPGTATMLPSNPAPANDVSIAVMAGGAMIPVLSG